MAPVEFEKELKKRLRSREAKPGDDAWQRIAARLDAEGPVPQQKPRWWVGLAAASVALLASLVFFWDRPEPMPAIDPMVETPGEPVPGPEGKQDPPLFDLPADAGQERIAGDDGTGKARIPKPTQASAAVAYKDAAGVPNTTSPATTTPPEGPGRTDLPGDRLPDTAPPAVAMSSEDVALGDVRIDSLLKEAQKSIAARDTTQKAATVDPSALLAQAEEELDQTFREQVIQKLREGYNRMRQSVAARKQ